MVRLYASSCQLPTNVLLASRFGDRSVFCRYGCPTLEDPHYVFVVHCSTFQDLRDEYSRSLVLGPSNSLCWAALSDSIRSHVDHIVVHLFRDDASWPLGSSLFYLGLLPPLLPNNFPYSSLSTVSRRLLTCMAHSCHPSAIRLAGRIWGMVVPHYASTKSLSPGGLDVGFRRSGLT